MCQNLVLSTMATTTSSLFSVPSLRTSLKPHRPTLLPCPNFVPPNLTLKFSRLGISYAKGKGSKQVVISCLVEDDSKAFSESNPGATIDLKLPRRSLLVQFTCNACGVRSQKLINRLAYEKGLVFVQCTGCSQYHKLVDNLNLVVEYDFREEINTSSDADQV
ncbi:hypothetical protein L1987_38884 [Smallanthus sonchifolius]|uniref:Uncharacterized protein n=1 Tax=Smallanthus sonchifolius TaxID=185202 RepID=A0ACB9HLM1_9ASTR|nr:hypothetical protein L1987_38884 [Smallanthus sonchifolius]